MKKLLSKVTIFFCFLISCNQQEAHSLKGTVLDAKIAEIEGTYLYYLTVIPVDDTIKRISVLYNPEMEIVPGKNLFYKFLYDLQNNNITSLTVTYTTKKDNVWGTYWTKSYSH